MLYQQEMKELKTDVLIVGGGVGGCAAAAAVTSLGYHAILTEPTGWLGGQLTSQAVPPDEHPWIERCGCTTRYRRFRQAIRDRYRTHPNLLPASRNDPMLNPGLGTVSGLCHEPRVALEAIQQMLTPARASEKLNVMLGVVPTAVDRERRTVRTVAFVDQRSGEPMVVHAKYVLDASELGDLLPLGKVPYVTGAESRRDTNEPHAPDGTPQPDNVQALTWCFPLAFDPTPGADHRIGKPDRYDHWRDHVPAMSPPWTGPWLRWDAVHPITLRLRRFELFGREDSTDFGSLWHYRRIRAASHYAADARPHEVTLVNWPQNDYVEGNIIDKPANMVEQYLTKARGMSLALVYWLQNDAPRPDGGIGYPGLYLCPDVVGTGDGLAQAPYIRESRRIKAVYTITENDVGVAARGNRPAECYPDSVGIGYYRIDLHPSTGGNNYIDVASRPFQIPLGALLPQDTDNLLAACKNIGTTHITNGCYRLHPVEWNIGETAGLLAAYCLAKGVSPHAVRERPSLLRDFQSMLVAGGIELAWPADIIELGNTFT